MTTFYTWNSNGDDFATVSGVTATESLLLTPRGFAESEKEKALLIAVEDERGVLPLGDFPHTGVQQPRVLSSSAWEVLGPLLSDAGKIKHAAVSGIDGSYYLWSCATVIDCLDETESRIFESLSGYRKLIKPVFRRGCHLPNSPFVIQGFESQDVWVDRKFKAAVERAGLTGAEFRMSAELVD